MQSSRLVNQRVIEGVVAEIGVDMRRFPSDRQRVIIYYRLKDEVQYQERGLRNSSSAIGSNLNLGASSSWSA